LGADSTGQMVINHPGTPRSGSLTSQDHELCDSLTPVIDPPGSCPCRRRGSRGGAARLRCVREGYCGSAVLAGAGTGVPMLLHGRPPPAVRGLRCPRAGRGPRACRAGLRPLLPAGSGPARGMRTLRADAAGRLPRRHRAAVVRAVLPAPGAAVRQLRRDPQGDRDHCRRATLRPVLCPAASAMRPVRPHPRNRGESQGRRPGPMLLLPPGAGREVLAMRAATNPEGTPRRRANLRMLLHPANGLVRLLRPARAHHRPVGDRRCLRQLLPAHPR
jgi:hypothetical protein